MKIENTNNKKNVTLFILSNIINRFGDSVDIIAFMWLTYEVTNSVMMTGIVVAFNGLPSIILGVFSGVLTDHYDKKKLIVIGDGVRGIIVTVIVILYKMQCINIIILCIATIAISTFEILSTPARRSILPFLIEKDELRKENSRNATGKIISQILGLSIAGTIINIFGVDAAVMLDAVTFFISALLILNLKFEDNSIKENKKYNSIVLEIKESILIIIKKIVILKTTIMATVVNIFIGGFNILVLSLCKNILGNNSQGQSIINTLSIIGILTISLLFSIIKKKLDMGRLIDIGFVGMGVCFVLFAFCKYNIVVYLIAYLYGVATGCITVSSVTILQNDIPLNHMGKVMAVVSLINESSIPLGNILVGIMLQYFDASRTFLIYGIGIIFFSALFIIFFNRLSRKKADILI